MEMSEQTNDLFAAFAKFQGELENVTKDTQGHGYKYADLAACIQAAKHMLAKHGLAVTQLMGGTATERTLITMMTHSSGQWMRSEFVMEKANLQGGAGKNPAQVLGSAITYMRRYAYAAIIGLAQEDDDAACNTPRNNRSQQQQKQTGLSAEQIAEVTNLIESKGYTVQQVTQSWGISSLKDIPANNYQTTINSIQSWK